MQQIDIVATLRKSFPFVEWIENEDLKILMKSSKEIDTYTLVNIIIEASLKVSTYQIRRILNYLPINHQKLIEETLNSLFSNKKEGQLILYLYQSLKYDMYFKTLNQYTQDRTPQKKLFTSYIESLSESEANYALSMFESNKTKIKELIL